MDRVQPPPIKSDLFANVMKCWKKHTTASDWGSSGNSIRAEGGSKAARNTSPEFLDVGGDPRHPVYSIHNAVFLDEFGTALDNLRDCRGQLLMLMCHRKNWKNLRYPAMKHSLKPSRYNWTVDLPSCPELCRCSPRSHPNTLSLRIPRWRSFWGGGRDFMNVLRNVISFPCFLHTGSDNTRQFKRETKSLGGNFKSIYPEEAPGFGTEF